MTLNIRVVTAPETTEAVAAAMAVTDGVAKLAVVRNARRPAGDVIQFDVAPSVANVVLSRLESLGVHRHGPIAVEGVDAVIDRLAPSRRQRVLQRDLPPIWHVVEARIGAEATYSPSFYLLLLCAGLIAATGILSNSQILIVGAMVVGPEYNAIMAIALGIDRHDRPPVRAGLLALTAGFAAAIAASLLFGLSIRGLGETPHLYETGVRPVSEFINTPGLFSVVVAVLAGIVGVVSLTQSRTGALIGVFISVTTIPAAADIGLSLAYQSWHQAGGSLEQLLLNVFVLIAVGAGGLRLQRRLWRRYDARASAQTQGYLAD